MKPSNNFQLRLMDVPAKATVVEVKPNIHCGYCGGSEPTNGEHVLLINGIRLHPNHKECIESVKHPLFDLDAKLYQTDNAQ